MVVTEWHPLTVWVNIFMNSKASSSSQRASSLMMPFTSLIFLSNPPIFDLYHMYVIWICVINLSHHTETKMLSFWWHFRHWLHWTLSFWQRSVQPVTKILSKWRHFRFSALVAANGLIIDTTNGLSPTQHPFTMACRMYDTIWYKLWVLTIITCIKLYKLNIYIAKASKPWIGKCHIFVAQRSERSSCNRAVVGSSPTRGALFSTS